MLGGREGETVSIREMQSQCVGVDSTGSNVQILTAHEGNGGKSLSRGETQAWPTIH